MLTSYGGKITNSLVFRWLGANKLLMNAIKFGEKPQSMAGNQLNHNTCFKSAHYVGIG
jgi:hypothetical protein